MENEIWKPIVGWDRYEVSDLGRVRSLSTKKIMASQFNNSGYLLIMLHRNEGKRQNKTIHRIVAEAFLENPENKKQVNHINAIKPDNRLINLEWATDRENCRHAWDSGLMEKTRERVRARWSEWATKNAKENGDRLLRTRGLPVRSVIQMDMDGNVIAEYHSSREADRVTGLKGLRQVLRNGGVKGGFRWAWKEVSNQQTEFNYGE